MKNKYLQLTAVLILLISSPYSYSKTTTEKSSETPKKEEALKAAPKQPSEDTIRQQVSADTQAYNLPDGQVFTYKKPDWQYMFTELPNAAWQTTKLAFQPDKLGYWAAILASTAILYDQDEYLLKNIQRDGRDIGIGNDDHTKTFLEVGDINLLRLPTDTGSYMYFIGDGWTHFGIAFSFLAYGVSQEDYRAWNTAYQLMHGMALSSFFNQILKRSFGRESPNRKSRPRGRWSPFPSIDAYNKHTATYDAMPSGHVMTGTLVVTIINNNYPEYSHITLPVGVTLLSVLGWQMVNNGVHWASDYPLAIGMGIFYGNYVSNNWKFKSVSSKDESAKNKLQILPVVTREFQGLSISYDF